MRVQIDPDRLAALRPRVAAVDALRGVVMVIMALDHTRDFFHAGAMTFSPEDLSRTTPAIFLTRWITHICAPTFVFLAGLGAYLREQADNAVTPTSRFLWTRGLWLIALEITVMRLAMNFTTDAQYPVLLITLWALGASMIAMAALVHLPRRALAVVGVGIIVLHNTLDGVRAADLGVFSRVWTLLHAPGAMLIGRQIVVVGYPALPWIGVMAVGYCAGPLVRFEPERRRRVLGWAGVALLAAFVVVRGLNLYGDPTPWSNQPTVLFTALSFLRVTKYPPSLAFLLVTLGLAALAWRGLERRGLSPTSPLVVIGRTPLFYYVAHFWWLHVLSSLAAWLRYGSASRAFLFSPWPSMGGSPDRFPPDVGYPLGVVYAVWIFTVASMYPLCRRFAKRKARGGRWWLSYL